MKSSGIDNKFDFKIDHFYENINGIQIYICGEVKSTIYDKTILCEVGSTNGRGYSYFEPLDWFKSPKDGDRWMEIPKEKFLLYNHPQTEESYMELKRKIKIYERIQKIKSIRS